MRGWGKGRLPFVDNLQIFPFEKTGHFRFARENGSDDLSRDLLLGFLRLRRVPFLQSQFALSTEQQNELDLNTDGTSSSDTGDDETYHLPGRCKQRTIWKNAHWRSFSADLSFVNLKIHGDETLSLRIESIKKKKSEANEDTVREEQSRDRI